MTYDLTFAERLEAVEAAVKASIKVEDLPLAELQRKLERTWHPDASTLLEPGSVTEAAQGFKIVAAEINSAGGTARWYTRDDSFTATRNAIGDYTIGDLGFRAPPLVDLTIISTPGGGISLQASPTSGGFSVFTFDTSTGAALDAAWHFIALAAHTG
jgi:hypothetical protein